MSSNKCLQFVSSEKISGSFPQLYVVYEVHVAKVPTLFFLFLFINLSLRRAVETLQILSDAPSLNEYLEL